MGKITKPIDMFRELERMGLIKINDKTMLEGILKISERRNKYGKKN
jgi:hypothetical protein